MDLRELPKPGSGTRIVPTAELVAMMADPRMRDAVDLIERAMGQETAIKQAIRHQIERHVTQARIEHEMRKIDIGMRLRAAQA